MGAGSGRMRMNREAPCSSLPCSKWKASSCTESSAKAPFQLLLINWFAKVANDPIVQGAGAFPLVGIGSNENCRNRVPCFDQVFGQLDAGHRRHASAIKQAVSITRGEAMKFAADEKVSTL
jgi:hypothetical protein